MEVLDLFNTIFEKTLSMPIITELLGFMFFLLIINLTIRIIKR